MMATMDVSEPLAQQAAAEERLIGSARTLTDTDLAADSLVPPWTRGHVLTHVARATDSLARLVDSARTGVPTPQYPSTESRAADIEAGASRPLDEQLADFRAASQRFHVAVEALPDAAWSVLVQPRSGAPRTAAGLLELRLREIEVHNCDLAAEYTFADIPAEIARTILDDIVGNLARRDPAPTLRIEVADGDHDYELGTGGPLITGDRADLLAWLTGRFAGDRLISSSGPVPEAPAWI
jgi:maleylpyruvate isomerase